MDKEGCYSTGGGGGGVNTTKVVQLKAVFWLTP